eukprot:Pgem_evm1s10056
MMTKKLKNSIHEKQDKSHIDTYLQEWGHLQKHYRRPGEFKLPPPKICPFVY